MAPTTPLSSSTRLTPIGALSLTPITDDPMNEVGRGLGQAPVEHAHMDFTFSPVLSTVPDSPNKRLKQCPVTPVKTPMSQRIGRHFNDLGTRGFVSVSHFALC